MKERLDLLLVRQGYFESREKAKSAIMAGLVYVDGAISDKPGMSIKEDAEIKVKGDPCPYVSRGGLKLEKALQTFHMDLDGKICMDVGASTGGFTDCMLSHGASKVYAVDVGYGQLDWKLRTDSRVVNIERCNFRFFDRAMVEEELDLITVDVSFISLGLIFPVAAPMLKPGGNILALVKPQFEAGREDVGKNGIVRDPKIHAAVIGKAVDLSLKEGLIPVGLTFSPITGAKGNIEYLLLLNKGEIMEYNDDGMEGTRIEELIREVVTDSHRELE